MSNFAFFLNSYNDVDNMTPVIWKFLENGEHPIVIFGTDYDYKNDYRINLLQEKYDLEIFTFPAEYNNTRAKRLSRLFKYILGSYNKYENFLKEHDISTGVFEWTVYYGSSIQNMFFGAAKNLKIPTISIPHGVSIYTNYDVTELDRKFHRKTGEIRKSNICNDVDLSVTPNRYTLELHICSGQDPTINEVWGSARYYPKWAKINLEKCPEFTASKFTDGKLKVVLMLPHWEYNVDISKTVSLINQLANLSWVYTVIKDHTRGNGGLDDDFRDQLNSLPNVEASVPAHSPALIRWSDVVISFGSSIAIEAILQDKPLINPSYLHTNQTIFEKTESAYEPKNSVEVIETLKKIQNNNLKLIYEKNKLLLLKEAVYGGKDEYNILEYYCENISNIKNRKNYKHNSAPHHIIKVSHSLTYYASCNLMLLYVLIRDDPTDTVKLITKKIWKIF